MAQFAFEEAKEFTYPNLTVYRKMRNGVQVAWRLEAHAGYVFYDVNANDTEVNLVTAEVTPVICCHTVMSIPLDYNFNNFHWKAMKNNIQETTI